MQSFIKHVVKMALTLEPYSVTLLRNVEPNKYKQIDLLSCFGPIRGPTRAFSCIYAFFRTVASVFALVILNGALYKWGPSFWAHPRLKTPLSGIVYPPVQEHGYILPKKGWQPKNTHIPTKKRVNKQKMPINNCLDITCVSQGTLISVQRLTYLTVSKIFPQTYFSNICISPFS